MIGRLVLVGLAVLAFVAALASCERIVELRKTGVDAREDSPNVIDAMPWFDAHVLIDAHLQVESGVQLDVGPGGPDAAPLADAASVD